MIDKLKIFIDSDNKKRLISNFLSLIVLRGFQFLLPLITLPYLVKTIGINNFGIVNFALSLGMYFGAIIQFGFGITATREIARHRDNPVKLAQIYSATLTVSILLALISAALFTLIVLSFEIFHKHLNLYLFTLAFIVFQSLFPIWFFQGIEKMNYITFLTLSTSAMFIVSLFLFVKQQDDFVFIPLLNAISEFITLIISFALIKQQFKVKIAKPSRQKIIQILKEGRYAFVAQLAPNLYNNSAIFLLGIFTNNTLVGIYTAATKVINAVISSAYILSNTFLPYLSRNLQKHKVFQNIMLPSGLVLTVATFIMAEWITILLFSADNIEIMTYIQALAICIFFLFTTITYSNNFLMLIDKDSIVKNIAFYTSLSFFGIALIIIPLWGIWGSITTLVGARFTMAFLYFISYLKYKHILKTL